MKKIKKSVLFVSCFLALGVFTSVALTSCNNNPTPVQPEPEPEPVEDEPGIGGDKF